MEHSPSNKIEMEDVLVAAGWLKAKGVGMNIQGNMRCPDGDSCPAHGLVLVSILV